MVVVSSISNNLKETQPAICTTHKFCSVSCRFLPLNSKLKHRHSPYSAVTSGSQKYLREKGKTIVIQGTTCLALQSHPAQPRECACSFVYATPSVKHRSNAVPLRANYQDAKCLLKISSQFSHFNQYVSLRKRTNMRAGTPSCRHEMVCFEVLSHH